MYVKRVVLESVRGFKRIDFKFDRPDENDKGWRVITGANASGFDTPEPFVRSPVPMR